MTRLWNEQHRIQNSISWQGQATLSAIVSKAALRHTQPPVHCVLRTLSPRLKQQQGSKATHSTPSSLMSRMCTAMSPLPSLPSRHVQEFHLVRHIYMHHTTISFLRSVCADTSRNSHQTDIHNISYSGLLLQSENIFLTYISMPYEMQRTHL
jgi:hypothetical protein